MDVYVESTALQHLCMDCFLGAPLPVWSCGASIARLVDLGIESLQGWTIIMKAQGKMRALGTLREMVVVTVRVHAAAIHRRI